MTKDKYVAFHDGLQAIVDDLLRVDDPVIRLEALVTAQDGLEALLRVEAYSAAYEARSTLPDALVAKGAGISRSRVRYLADKHRARTGAPRLPRIRTSSIDPQRVMDLSGAGGRRTPLEG